RECIRSWLIVVATRWLHGSRSEVGSHGKVSTPKLNALWSNARCVLATIQDDRYICLPSQVLPLSPCRGWALMSLGPSLQHRGQEVVSPQMSAMSFLSWIT